MSEIEDQYNADPDAFIGELQYYNQQKRFAQERARRKQREAEQTRREPEHTEEPHE